MRERSRAEDVFARLEGGMFGILARGIQERQAHAFAERLRAMVAAHAFHDTIGSIALTVSVGTATLTPPAGRVTAAELVARAEQALRDAKEGGRNRTEPVPKRRVQRDTLL
jgi:diguanylate cyclase